MGTESNIAVHKYGGSSLATPEKIQAVADKVIEAHRAGKSLVVVVSATGKTTNQLLDRARTLNATPSGRELDLLLSSGEQISSALMAMAIQHRGVDAVALTGRQAGVRTCGTYGSADIIEVDPQRVLDELAQNRVVVVTGYQGLCENGELNTLGRGGSDTSAIALADALGASCCEIYSDVDGVYSSDPRVVPEARRIDALDYDSMLELSRQGAKVLNARAVAFASEKRVVIHAKSTFQDGRGTRIHDDGAEASGAAAVAGWGDVIRVRGERNEALLEELSVGEILLEGDAAPVDVFVTGENIPDSEAFAAHLRESYDATVDTGLGTVAVVGPELGNRLEAIERAKKTLESEGIAVVADATSPRSITSVVAADAVGDGIRALHRAFVASVGTRGKQSAA